MKRSNLNPLMETSAYIKKLFKDPSKLMRKYHDPHVVNLMDKFYAGSHKVNPYAGNIAVGRELKRSVDKDLANVHDMNMIRAWRKKGYAFDPKTTTFDNGSMPFRKDSHGIRTSSIDVPVKDMPIDSKINYRDRWSRI